jgi:superfamily II DNA/RNA helicase
MDEKQPVAPLVLRTYQRSAVNAIFSAFKRGVRRQLIDGFRNGSVEVLVNVGVLTEGFDVPEVEAIHLLRPTRSTALLLQMIGRGTRRTESKERCLVFDYADDLEGRELATIGAIFGVPSSFDFCGGRVVEQVNELERIGQELGWDLIEGIDNLEKLRTELLRVDFLKLYASSAEETAPFSTLRWHRKGEDGFVVSWKNRSEDELQLERAGQWLVRERSVLEEQNLWGLSEQLELQRNQLGMWEISVHRKGAIAPETASRLRLERDFSRAVAWADSWVRRQRPHVVVLLDTNAAWNHRGPASPCAQAPASAQPGTSPSPSPTPPPRDGSTPG